MFTISYILLFLHLVHFATSQAPPAENVVIFQPSEHLLQCPIPSEDCANVQWNLVTFDDAVYVIGNKLSVHEKYRQNYQINSTSGYCMLRILHAATNSSSGHINCLNLENGNPVKAFNIYIIADGPKCSANVSSSDGYVTDGDILTYTCDLTYNGGGATGSVEMSWFSNHLSPVTGTVTIGRNHISSSYEVIATKPLVPQYTCRTTFGNKNGSTTVVIQDCNVNPVNIGYAVTNVRISDNGSSAVLGSNVTCMADGIPLPNFRWVDSTTGAIVSNDSSVVVASETTEMYHCEAWNHLNIQPIKSSSVIFNNTFIVIDKPITALSSAWLLPVVICVPLAILLIIFIMCFACPVCPVNKTLKNRRGKFPVKEKMRPDDNHYGPSIVPLQSSPGAEYPENFSNPRPRPRSSVSNRTNPSSNDDSFSTQGSLMQTVPPPKKNLLSGAGAGSSTNDLLYVDIASPAASPDGVNRPRPVRPGAKPQSRTIYTPVVRS